MLMSSMAATFAALRTQLNLLTALSISFANSETVLKRFSLSAFMALSITFASAAGTSLLTLLAGGEPLRGTFLVSI
ncbi:hypothetical protein ES703_103034 [subsurface metagenome]